MQASLSESWNGFAVQTHKNVTQFSTYDYENIFIIKDLLALYILILNAVQSGGIPFPADTYTSQNY